MDFTNIINDSIDKAIDDLINKKITDVPRIGDKVVDSLTKENILLMNYSIKLLSTYHDELKKVLAEQGIII